MKRLADLERDDQVNITLSDETVISGRVSPMVFMPEDRLLFEIRSDDDQDVRLKVTSTYEDDKWTPVLVKQLTNDGKEWISLGEVMAVEVKYQEGQTDYQNYQSDVRF